MSGKPSAESYVYAYYVDGVIRYIGKGKRYRINNHLLAARALLQKWEIGKKGKGLEPFHAPLAKALQGGAKIEKVVLHKDLTDADAYLLEAREIDRLPKGQLWGGTTMVAANFGMLSAPPQLPDEIAEMFAVSLERAGCRSQARIIRAGDFGKASKAVKASIHTIHKILSRQGPWLS